MMNSDRKLKRVKVRAGADPKTGEPYIVSIPQSLTGRHYMLTGDTVLDLPVNSFVRRRIRKGELIELSDEKPAAQKRKPKELTPDTRHTSKPITKEEG